MFIYTTKTSIIKTNFLEKIIDLLKETFSNCELRSDESQKKAFLHTNYRISYCMCNDDIVGFVLWWDFDSIIFVEYLCVANNYQHNYIGSSLLDSLTTIRKMIVVEVAKDKNKKKFYKNNNYVYNKRKYDPIPLNNDSNVNNYYIFSYKRALTNLEYSSFVRTIHLEEYQF